MKFKVGDRVKVTGHECLIYFKNDTGTIVDINKIGSLTRIAINFDKSKSFMHDCDGKTTFGHGYWVDSSLVEPLKSETIVIYRHNDTVVAKNTQTGEKAVAKCHPDDEFDFNIGAKVAFDRLVGGEVKEEPKEEYYNGKVVPTKGKGVYITVGKIYNVVDGFFKDDKGNKRPSGDMPVKSLDQLNDWMFGDFIEVVE